MFKALKAILSTSFFKCFVRAVGLRTVHVYVYLHCLSLPSIQTACTHYSDVIMSAMASQITGVPIVCSTVCSGADQRKHQSSASLAFVWGIHRWPVNSPHKGQVTQKMFPFDDVIMRFDQPSRKTWTYLYFQHRVCWCSGHVRSCSIDRRCNVLVSTEYSHRQDLLSNLKY